MDASTRTAADEPARYEITRRQAARRQLTVVIPVLNEVDVLPRATELVRSRAKHPERVSIVAADCGSTDGSRELLAERDDLLLVDVTLEPTTRARAIRTGATAALEQVTSEEDHVLLFLDADTEPPTSYDTLIDEALQEHETIGGAFEFAMDGPQFGLRVVEFINRVRYRIWPRYYGDQAVFVRAEAYQQIGGCPDVPILESSAMCQRLWKHGRLTLISTPIKTSPRRFLDGGIYRVLAHDALIWLRDLLGLSTRKFGPRYWQWNKRRGSSLSG
jgi:glycosyltransferase involved in cell wall biosynthesis